MEFRKFLDHVRKNVPEDLEAAIREFLDAWNEDPKPFAWEKTADEILANVGRYCYRTPEGRENQKRKLSDDDC